MLSNSVFLGRTISVIGLLLMHHCTSGTLCQCTKKNPELINYTDYKLFHYTIINFTFYDIKKKAYVGSLFVIFYNLRVIVLQSQSIKGTFDSCSTFQRYSTHGVCFRPLKQNKSWTLCCGST